MLYQLNPIKSSFPSLLKSHAAHHADQSDHKSKELNDSIHETVVFK